MRRVFELVNGTPELVTSFDAIAAERPRDIPRRAADAVRNIHVDQRRTAAGDGVQCVQGVLSLTPTTARTGGTTVVPGAFLVLLARPAAGSTASTQQA